jgi:hypothetical protein
MGIFVLGFVQLNERGEASNGGLQLSRIVSVRKQLVAGTLYFLNIEATDGDSDEARTFEVAIYGIYCPPLFHAIQILVTQSCSSSHTHTHTHTHTRTRTNVRARMHARDAHTRISNDKKCNRLARRHSRSHTYTNTMNYAHD